MVQYETVTLPSLKVARPTSSKSSDRPLGSSQSDATGNRTALDQPLSGASHSRYPQQFVSQNPGNELAPEAQIWQVYAEEAREYDNELVESENKNLDLMLLFAALFSAILTAFIIESKNLLQQDSTELSVTLLLTIAQSQRRIEQGVPQITPPIELPSFSSTSSARWINGLWFTALALSLAAALIAMLAKEWLMAFTASRPRPPHTYALIHQDRYQGLIRWGALHMTDLLPSMLHLSLLFFSLGLAIYLWTLDPGIAIAEVVITAFTLLFYIGTTVLGATYESSPFVTQVSKYLRVLLHSPFRNNAKSTSYAEMLDKGTNKESIEKELQALLWLTEHARDPLTADYACQALAGLKMTSTIFHTEEESSVTREPQSAIHSGGEDHEASNHVAQTELLANPAILSSNRFAMLASLHEALAARLIQARQRLPQEPAGCRGQRMAELANVFPVTEYKTITATAISALDSVRNGECSELTPDVHALFATADLGITVALARTWYPNHTNPSEAATEPQLIQSTTKHAMPMKDHSSSSADHSVPIEISDEISFEDVVTLFELRARYSRTLAHIGVLLDHNNRGNLPIGTFFLIRLLRAIQSAAICLELNVEHQLSVSWPQSKDKPDILPHFFTSIIPGGVDHFKPYWIGLSGAILTELMQLFGNKCTESTPSLELSAGSALQVLYPVILKQAMHMRRMDPKGIDIEYRYRGSYVEHALGYWPPDEEVRQGENLERRTLNQLLVVAAMSVSLGSPYDVECLVKPALDALLGRARTVHGADLAIELAREHSTLVSDLICQTCVNYDEFPGNPADSLLELCVIKHSDRTLLARGWVPPSALPQLLRLVLKADMNVTRTEQILTDLKSIIQSDSKPWLSSRGYLEKTMKDAEMFTALVDIAEQEQYTQAVAGYIKDLITSIHESKPWSWGLIEVPKAAIPALLDAALLAGYSLMETEVAQFRDHMTVVLSILSRLDREGKETAMLHPTIDSIHELLTSVSNPDEEMEDVLSGFEKWKGDDSWIFRGLERLFELPATSRRHDLSSPVQQAQL